MGQGHFFLNFQRVFSEVSHLQKYMGGGLSSLGHGCIRTFARPVLWGFLGVLLTGGVISSPAQAEVTMQTDGPGGEQTTRIGGDGVFGGGTGSGDSTINTPPRPDNSNTNPPMVIVPEVDVNVPWVGPYPPVPPRPRTPYPEPSPDPGPRPSPGPGPKPYPGIKPQPGQNPYAPQPYPAPSPYPGRQPKPNPGKRTQPGSQLRPALPGGYSPGQRSMSQDENRSGNGGWDQMDRQRYQRPARGQQPYTQPQPRQPRQPGQLHPGPNFQHYR